MVLALELVGRLNLQTAAAGRLILDYFLFLHGSGICLFPSEETVVLVTPVIFGEIGSIIVSIILFCW